MPLHDDVPSLLPPVPDRPVPDRPVPDRPVPDRPVPDRPVPDRPALDRLVELAEAVAGFGRARITLRIPGHDTPGVIGARIPDVPTPVHERPLVAGDAAQHPDLADLPAVRAGTVRAYAGVPLREATGAVVGALEVIGESPARPGADLAGLLDRVGAAVVAELDTVVEVADLESDRQRWQLAVDAGGVGSFDWNLVTDRLDWDERLMELFGYRPDAFDPHIDSFRVRLHPDDLPPTEAAIAEAVAGSGRYRAEYRVVRDDGTVRWIQARGQVTRDVDGRPVRMLGVAFDVTEAHQARSLARRTRDRLGMLAAVSEALTGRRDVQEAVGRLAQVLVPRLADFCVVSIIGDDGKLRDIGSHHPDPDRAVVLARYSAHRLEGLHPSAWALRALRSGRLTVIPFPATEQILPLLSHPVARATLATLNPAFGLCVPLRTRDEVLGVVTLFNGVDSGPFGSTDQQVAAEVASRAAVALDAARTFQRQGRIAEALQRSLLTAPPATPPWRVAVRYVPSLDDVQVGGDWYDAFPLADGSLVVTVGDVMGHDSAAAALMGQLRSMLRGIFVAADPAPAAALAVADDAMSRLQLPGSATVIAARLLAGGVAAGSGDTGADVVWSTAGHPPPLVVGPHGARLIATTPDPPLGVRPGLVRHDRTFRLEPGETMLCYTDGLVERRDEDIDVGLARLRAVAQEAGPDPETLCDAVLARLSGAHARDDVVALAVRCDRPR